MRKTYLVFPADHETKLTCSASGHPKPTVKWYKDGRQLEQMPDGDGKPLTPTSFTINFNSIRPIDSGQYKCIVSNKAGSISYVYTVIVKGKLFYSTSSHISSMYKLHNLNKATCIYAAISHWQSAIINGLKCVHLY